MSITSPFPLETTYRPLSAYLHLPLSQCGLNNEAVKELAESGLFYVAQLAMCTPAWLNEHLSVPLADEVRDVMSELGIELGCLPGGAVLRRSFNHVELIMSHLSTDMIMEIFAAFAELSGCHAGKIGAPTVLALVLHPNLNLGPADEAQLNADLSPHGLRLRMQLEEVFQGIPPKLVRLTEKQIKLLATPVKDLALGCEDQLAQFCEVLGMELTMLHVMVVLLAILPADRPVELTDWYEKIGVPLQPWPLDDLHRASEFILR